MLYSSIPNMSETCLLLISLKTIDEVNIKLQECSPNIQKTLKKAKKSSKKSNIGTFWISKFSGRPP